ncbi:two-component response regulator [Heliomicrobium modesticaldum Ice1]|uniref:Stage 0 sporulation protein A homolog n=1 Tax=Heliobacterium modesticaldum (strain ATCC 51547 / Ice1) TaxID=498761 RepID=B0TDB2_HELMI|nr:response regulator transcription factor [Heliomicrobium modesticaldum]ABZ84153.1 two-component response regulator [Heliomicrobium modesticaldum Ice1]
MEGKKVLIVEDDTKIQQLLVLYLEKKGYRTAVAQRGAEALRLFESEQPDLILLDILLPDMDGYQICQEIRSCSNVPILFMSCMKEADNIIQALKLGGDDYITKPFDPKVLMARVEAKLRRAPIFRRTAPTEEPAPARILVFDDLEIDLANYRVAVGGQPVSLAAKELQLLFFLAQHPNQVFTAQELYTRIWGYKDIGDYRTVMTHISNIRKKIKTDPSAPERIQNIRGFGYKFNL